MWRGRVTLISSDWARDAGERKGQSERKTALLHTPVAIYHHVAWNLAVNRSAHQAESRFQFSVRVVYFACSQPSGGCESHIEAAAATHPVLISQ